MKIFKKILRWIFYFVLIPTSYFLISLLLTAITINERASDNFTSNTIYLTTNGIHLDIVMPKEHIDPSLLADLKYNPNEHYLSFGWGDEDFYLNTPTWGDLTFGNAFGAMFLKSSTLMHITRYRAKQSHWIQIKVNDRELRKLNTYLLESFSLNANGTKQWLKDKGYSARDDFYKAIGSYSCVNTCNSWVNTAFKQSGLKACYWTPFDFGLINKYE